MRRRDSKVRFAPLERDALRRALSMDIGENEQEFRYDIVPEILDEIISVASMVLGLSIAHKFFRDRGNVENCQKIEAKLPILLGNLTD